MLQIRPSPIHGAIVAMLWAPVAFAADFNEYGSSPPVLVAPDLSTGPDLVFELGMGIGAAPAYEGSTQFRTTYNPIIKLERLNIPGLIDIGGKSSQGGFRLAPSIVVQGERKAETFPELAGLNDIAATYELGGKVGYEFVFNDAVSAEVYGKLRYAVGGAEGLVGDVGLDVTARLTSQLELVGGVSASFADEKYMGTFFGVTSAESVASGGRYAEYDPAGGVKSFGVKATAKYEFIPDTFANFSAEYRRLSGSAVDSPIIMADAQNQFIFGVGLSRKFSIDY